MGFILAYLKRGLPLAAMAAAVFSAQAQGAGPQQGQPILFSSPDSEPADTTNMPSLMPKPPGALDLGDAARAPENFNLNPMGEAAPLTLGPGFFGESAEQRDLRRNWTLLTPAEILGAATPEKMMGISERNAFGQPKNLTALERYTERQNQLQLRLSKTNAQQSDDSSSAWNFSGDSYGTSNSFSSGWRNPQMMANPLFDSASDEPALARQNGSSAWLKLFGRPGAGAAPSMAQQSDMDRFRQLLNPGSPAVTPAANSPADGIKTSLPQTMLGSSLDQPVPNRIAASFAPLSSGISKAPELPKMPTAWSQGYTSAPPASAWAPQQAPWLSPEPQPFAAPQRKF